MKRKLILVILILLLSNSIAAFDAHAVVVDTATSALSSEGIYYVRKACLLGGTCNNCIIVSNGATTLNNAKTKFDGTPSVSISMSYSGDIKNASYSYHYSFSGDRAYQNETGQSIEVLPGTALQGIVPEFIKRTETDVYAQSKSGQNSTRSYTKWTSGEFCDSKLVYTYRLSSRGQNVDGDSKTNPLGVIGFSGYGPWSIDNSSILVRSGSGGNYRPGFGSGTAVQGTLPTKVDINTKSCVYGSCTLINSTVEGAPASVII